MDEVKESNALPDDLCDLAFSAGLHVEKGEVLFSELQGTEDAEAICLDRWLTWHDGGIRVRLRMIYHDASSQEGGFSDKLTANQALEVIKHWGVLQAESVARHYQAGTDRWRKLGGDRQCH